jgi:hypothetical protein
MVDSAAPVTARLECMLSEIVDAMKLLGKSCPYCKDRVFEREYYAIS